MKIYRYPDEAQLREITTRPTKDAADLTATVSAVLADIRERGDDAVLDYEAKFDHVDLRSVCCRTTATTLQRYAIIQCRILKNT